MTILGLDLSLTAPGFAIDLGPYTLKPRGAGVERLAWFDEYMTMFASSQEPRLAVIEHYAFNSPYGREALGELGGVVKLALHKLGIPHVVIAPATLKKYATGSGKANKDEMLAAAIKRSGLDITNNNVADAWWLYQMGVAHYFPEKAVAMPELNRGSLNKIDWPNLKGEK